LAGTLFISSVMPAARYSGFWGPD